MLLRKLGVELGISRSNVDPVIPHEFEGVYVKNF